MAYLYPLMAVFIWAGNQVVNKLSVGAIEPEVISFYRWLLALILLTPFFLRGLVKNLPQIFLQALKLMVLSL